MNWPKDLNNLSQRESFKGKLMGLFDIFKKDDKRIVKARLDAFNSKVMDAFSAMRNDLMEQSRWISYLHEHTMGLKESHSSHKQELVANKQDLLVQKQDLVLHQKKVIKWIEYLNESSQKQQKDLQKLQESIANAIGVYNEHLTELYERVETSKSKINEKKMKALVMEEVQEMLEDYESKSHKDIEKHVEKHVRGHVSKLKEDLMELAETAIPEPETKIVHMSHSPLSNPEQKLLTLLFNEADPLSYDTISQKTGHSINTVRVNMNSLKKKGLIEDHTLPSGVKLFNLTNKEKIKKIYNLQMI